MTLTPASSLQRHAAFQNLSSSGQRLLAEHAKLVRFRVGQGLTDGGILPAKVMVILQGQARLLGREQGRMTTLSRLGPGDLVGVVSLLRGEPCESVSAATELLAACLDDQHILELHRTEPSFRQWCLETVWRAEVAALLDSHSHRQALNGSSVRDVLAQAIAEARSVPLTIPAIQALRAEGREIFLASLCADGGPPLSSRLEEGAALPNAAGPFGLRLLSLPQGLLDTLLRQPDQPPLAEPEPTPGQAVPIAAEVAPESPQVSELSFAGKPRGKLIRANGAAQEAVACLQMLAFDMKLAFRRDAIDKVMQDALRRGQQPNLQLCGQLASNLGLHVMGTRVPASQGTRLQTPALVSWKEGFALVRRSHARGMTLASPSRGLVELRPEQLEQEFPDGIALLVVDRTNATPEQKFGPSWFWPALKRYRGVLLQVLAASFVVQLFTLANPLLIQVIIDKVIRQRSLDTLQVLGIALLVVSLLEGVLTSLRTFLFTETTNRIDQRLGAEIIDHLLRLPLNYFDRRPVGELSSRVAELEKIRNFLTGQALTTVLDAAFSVIYIAVMVLYSWVLTLVALSVLPIQIGLTVLGAPLFRRQYRKSAESNAKTQSHLVEVLTGVQTVKAQNVEMVSRWKWQEFYDQYIAHSFEKTITGTALSQTSQVLQKISQLLVLWMGATLVLSGDLTLGQLIAFRILSSYVTQPILRLSSIWQTVQELRVSFERLADVIDTPQESDEADQAKIPLPPICGNVVFENVSFRFRADQPPVLKNIDLTIPSGTFVGIVGQSGSGKSTLMKLLPRLYNADEGRILIDNYDIDKVELYSLRRQIGIVPQDPLLFSGTVAENIALTQPDAESDALVQAAQLACAHEFIMDLPSGYSSPVGERGAGLSGGQRQRIAIARTLLSRPKLLVMDEATSALDYDTERRVCDNLVEALHDCTVFFITHRLSTIRRADLIVMMHQGAIVETGTHDELMALRGRYYALYRQQEAG
ncbi:peptidase domain-containing ABC transporter [Synechococcus sp. CBW1006]|uniref:peptidase domain-containing ABC transporter n=1 Tax=Synechococcus sp. CBW1006 TaxID=1353138 RepID=UPI0018CD2318|nr:peptidase domain-containing ABC transporter [Synechococcus sp. CBW1006]QPN67345.1 peptidase domain-containing ABC transporter [Synechococcus sp. CBW1006]